MEKQGDVNNDCGKHPGLPEIARNDPETMAHYPTPFDEEPTRRWIDWNLENYARYGLGLWVVVMKETGEFIRDCGLTFQNIDGEMLPEVGYHIHKKYWRRGFAKEAARSVRDWAFLNTEYDVLKEIRVRTNSNLIAPKKL